MAENELSNFDLFHFKTDYSQYMSYATRLQQIAAETNDADLIKQVNDKLAAFLGTTGNDGPKR